MVERVPTMLPPFAKETAKDSPKGGESVKTCTKCGETKQASEFRPGRCRDGLSSWCSACHNAATRAWRERNPEYVAAYNERRRVDPLPPWARAFADKGR